MLSLDHSLVGKGSHKTPCTLPFLQAQGPSLASLPLVTFQSFPYLPRTSFPKCIVVLCTEEQREMRPTSPFWTQSLIMF